MERELIESIDLSVKPWKISDETAIALNEKITSIELDDLLNFKDLKILSVCVKTRLTHLQITKDELEKVVDIIIDRTDKLFRRNWLWYVDEELIDNNEREILKEQDCLRNSSLYVVYLLKAMISKLNQEGWRKMFLFISRYCTDELSMAPWCDKELRKLSCQCLIELKKIGELNKWDIERTILIRLEEIRLLLKKLKVNDDLTKSGYKKTSNFKINGKLIGNSFTTKLDNLEKFKKDHISNLGVLYYCMLSFSIEKNWGLIFPLLLIFLDDSDLIIKRESCILSKLLLTKISESGEKIGGNIIIKTQTSKILQDSILPCLLSLPTLTPAKKSLLIIDISYDTIFKLFEVSTRDELKYYLLLNGLLNDILIPSIIKIKDYPKLLSLLLIKLRKLIVDSRNYSLVLSKQIVYTVLNILTDPFIIHSKEIVIKLLQILLLFPLNDFKYDILAIMGVLRNRIQIFSNDQEVLNFIHEISLVASEEHEKEKIV